MQRHVKFLLPIILTLGTSLLFAEVTTVNVDSFHLASPFWKGDTCFDEGITFIKGQGDQFANAKLLFRPARVIRIRNASRTITYAYGTDFTIDTTGKRILLTAGSSIPSCNGSCPIVNAERHDLHYKQAIITYTHTDTWPSAVGDYAGTSLPVTIGKLKNRQAVTFAIMGTSIPQGFNASGYQCFDTGAVRPFQPSYGWLLAALLKYQYGSTITFKNYSYATVTSTKGIEVMSTVAADHPDLVIIAYGMNECGEHNDTLRARATRMMSTIRATNPNVEFILESSTLPNGSWGGCVTNLPIKRTALKTLVGPGVVLADATQLWSDILASKRYDDMTGNNINHPNDWAHRLLAQLFMALLYNPAPSAIAPKKGIHSRKSTLPHHIGKWVWISTAGINPIPDIRNNHAGIFDIHGRPLSRTALRDHSTAIRIYQIIH